jgi:hypothetical protein
MGLFSGLTKIALSPLNGVAEIARDLSGKNDSAEAGLAILTLGASSVVKGVAKAAVEGADEIFQG